MEEKEERTTSQKVVLCNVVLFVIVGVILFGGWLLTSFDRPLPLNYEYSWVVFTLISMLSLQYVEFVNRLKHLLRHNKLLPKSSKEKAEQAAFLLQWTGFFFIITILALAIRIIWLSFSPEKLYALHRLINDLESQGAKESLEVLGKVFLFFDWIIIISFTLGSILRIAVFLHSYGGDLLVRWPWKCK